MINILGICGSPRKGGNSDLILEALLKGARLTGGHTRKIFLNGLRFKPCQECGGCDKTCRCILKDDLRRVYSAVEDADVIAIAAPIFFGSVPAQIKMMIDRFQPFWIKKEIFKKPPLFVKKRKGVFLCVSGSERRDFFENAKKIIKIFFAVLDIEYAGDIYCGGVDRKGSLNKGVLKKAGSFGARLARKSFRDNF
ncbi:MAG: flavodoxin family protein [Candidatus Omnitrophota bacterium]|nr:flavodoxin family protein [Candidatus Omnitrophota bacterium]